MRNKQGFYNHLSMEINKVPKRLGAVMALLSQVCKCLSPFFETDSGQTISFYNPSIYIDFEIGDLTHTCSFRKSETDGESELTRFYALQKF